MTKARKAKPAPKKKAKARKKTGRRRKPIMRHSKEG
jgi:hypothetical protein